MGTKVKKPAPMRGKTPKKSNAPIEMLKKTVGNSDVVLLTVDSRFPTPSVFVGKLCREAKVPLLVVLTKDDLVESPRAVGFPSVPFSAKYPGRYKKMILRAIYAAARKGKDSLVRVSVVGYPNTGKSSLINSISHRKSLSVSPIAGHTRAVQWIRFGRILLSDTPGVIPENVGKDKLVMMGSLNIDKEKDPVAICEKVIGEIFSTDIGRKKFFLHFDIPPCQKEEVIEAVARRRGRLMKGGEPNIEETAKIIVRDFQRGKIRLG